MVVWRKKLLFTASWYYFAISCTHRISKVMGPQNAVSHFKYSNDHSLTSDQQSFGYHSLKAKLTEGSIISQKITTAKWYVLLRFSRSITLMFMIQ